MDARAVVLRLFEEVLVSGHVDALDQLLSGDFRDRTPSPGTSQDRAGFIAKATALKTAFPDLRFTLDELISDNNVAAARWHWTGTQTGRFGSIAPTGRKVGVRGMDFYRVQDGRIVEHWDVVDQLGLFQQLGTIPAT